jgi:hypothetical protein
VWQLGFRYRVTQTSICWEPAPNGDGNGQQGGGHGALDLMRNKTLHVPYRDVPYRDVPYRDVLRDLRLLALYWVSIAARYKFKVSEDERDRDVARDLPDCRKKIVK